MSTHGFTEQELMGAYIISLSGFKTTRIDKVSPDCSTVYVKWGNSPAAYSFPSAFKDKVCFADDELRKKLEEYFRQEENKIKKPPIGPIPPLDSHPRPKVQPVWVEEKEKSDFSLKGNTLKPYHFYGTAALNIYHKGCKKLGWKTGHDDDFDKHTILYSQNITPEGYSLWFLTHHSWIEDVKNVTTKNYTWWNTIGCDIIHEDWIEHKLNDDHRHNLKYDASTRLTFAKGKNGQYFYIGLFKPIGIIWDRIDGPEGWGVYHTKVYQRIP